MLLQALENLRDGLLSLAYPHACRLCSGSVESWNNGIICPACWQNPDVTRLFHSQDCCVKCGLPLPSLQQFASTIQPAPAAVSITSTARHCGRCDNLPFTFARACGEYAGSLEANVLFLKSTPHLCPRLRHLLTHTYTANRMVLESDLVIPVPLHPARKQERGFNQAEIIAGAIAKPFHLKLNTRVLVRAKNTERHRAGMDEVDRARSVERAFNVTAPEVLQTRSVLLIDDLFTTGQTLAAATETLLASGATEVKVFTIARVVRASERRALA